MAKKPKPVFLIWTPGRCFFWDGLTNIYRDPWDGLVLSLMDFDGNVKREIKSGPFNILAPLGLEKNILRPFPWTKHGWQN